MRSLTIGIAICAAALLTAPAVASTPEHDIAFPPDWTIESVDEPLADGPARLLLRAYPAARSEECRLSDLGPAASVLAGLGVSDPEVLNRVALDLLGHDGSFARAYGLGYSDPWSSYVEGSLGDGSAFILYSFLGRDAWPGLEDAWFVLECSSDAQFHQDWAQIARTFAYATPAAILESTGPLVFDGRIELPLAGLALDVPDGWAAADLADPGLDAALASGGRAGEWLAVQLEHSIGDAMTKRSAAGEELVLWAWATDSETGWPEHCEVVIKAGSQGSAAEMVERGQAYVDGNDELRDTQAWALAELPLGEAARFDYRWTTSSGGTDYYLVGPSDQVTLSCQDYGFGDEPDVAAKRQRWETIAESMQSLP